MSGPVRTLALLALCTGLLAGCSNGGRPQPAETAGIPPRIARALASRSDAVASSLERGDACPAAREVAALARDTRRAVSSGRVPRRFRAPLLREVSALSAAVPACRPPAPPSASPSSPPSGDEHGRGEGHGDSHGKHKGRAKHGEKGHG